LSLGDVLFSKGELPKDANMYFLCAGQMQYIMDHEVTSANIGVWLAEPALWTRWVHSGTMMAHNDVRLCTLNGQQFQEIVTQYENSLSFSPSAYAEEFVRIMNARVARGEQVTDMPMPLDEPVQEMAGRQSIMRMLENEGTLGGRLRALVTLKRSQSTHSCVSSAVQ